MVANQDRARQAAEPNQVVPVTTVARQPRRLNAKHGADRAAANFSDQALKSGTLYQAGSRASQVIVDHEDVPKAEFACLVDQAVLSSLALLVLKNLLGGGLPKVNDRSSAQSLTREFGIHSLLLSTSRPRLPRRRAQAGRRAPEPVLAGRLAEVAPTAGSVRVDSIADWVFGASLSLSSRSGFSEALSD
jgi:hypothetical protein